MPDALPQLPCQRIRSLIATDSNDAALDVRTNQSPFLWRGNDARFEFGFQRRELFLDVSIYSSISVTVRSASNANAVLMTKTVDAEFIDNTLDDATWADESKQHVAVTFTGEETNLTLTGTQQSFWMVLSAITNEDTPRNVTLGYTNLLIREDGAGAAGDPPTNDPNYYSKGEVDALISGSGGRIYQGYVVIKNPDTARWHQLFITGVDAPALTIGPGFLIPTTPF